VAGDATARYEVEVDGRVAGFVEYRLEGGVAVLLGTEMDPGLDARGVTAQLVQGVLDDLRQRGLRVVPKDPVVGAWIVRNPAYLDLLAPGWDTWPDP
jgi:predicted GNAT family acetyltransferase